MLSFLITFLLYSCLSNAQSPVTPGSSHLQYIDGSATCVSMPAIQPIFYGYWDPPDISIIMDFLNGWPNTNHFNIITSTYSTSYIGQDPSIQITPQNTLPPIYLEPDVHPYGGFNLSESYIQEVIPMLNPTWTPNTINLVLLDDSTNFWVVRGGITKQLCTDWLGYHSSKLVNDARMIYAVVGSSAYQQGCISRATGGFNTQYSPNGNIFVDAMLTDIVHEVAEAITDPDFNEWLDPQISSGEGEIGDVCMNINTMYGSSTQYSPECTGWFGWCGSDYMYNIKFANATGFLRYYLVQQLWANLPNGNAGCAMGCTGQPAQPAAASCYSSYYGPA